MLQILEESALRLVSQFVFHDTQGMRQVSMVSRLIAVYSVCLEILPFRKRLVAHALEPRKRKLLKSEGISAATDWICLPLCSNGNASFRKGSHLSC